MFIYGKKEENNLRRCSLEFAKIIICQKKKKRWLQQFATLKFVLMSQQSWSNSKNYWEFQSKLYYVCSFIQVFLECYLRCDYHLDCKLSYFGGYGKCAEIRITDISAMGWAIALMCVCLCVYVCMCVCVCVYVCVCAIKLRKLPYFWVAMTKNDRVGPKSPKITILQQVLMC